MVLERPRANRRGEARRDVHRKHHGMLRATFVVNPDIAPGLRFGVFATPAQEYKAWVRFSNSSKRAQADTTADGRGVAIKLLDVDDNGAAQDFLFLNDPAFFASNAQAMAVAARLEADDKFPSGFFLAAGNLAGLAALIRMASAKPESPLDLTYYSQTPFQLGPNLIVKYRLRPQQRVIREKRLIKSPNYLFEALRADLLISEPAKEPFRFELAVQVRGQPDAAYPIDDATKVWDEGASPFWPVGELRIGQQRFATEKRMLLAENAAFDPTPGLQDHGLVGSLNWARHEAYRASRNARHGVNDVDGSKISYKEFWEEDDKSDDYVPPALEETSKTKPLLGGLGSLFPRIAALPLRILSSPAGYFAAPTLLALLVALGSIRSLDSHFHMYCWYCGPLRIAPRLPSEEMIPPAKLSAARLRDGYDRPGRLEADPVWNFRYGAVGAEGNGGLPYWIFRVLPKLFPEYFGERGDFSQFGLQLPDDDEYYEDYHGLPRGAILTEPVATLGGTQLQLGLRLVTFNCSSCHRGEYLDQQNRSHFVDGMPNLGIDTAGYKLAVFSALTDPKFTSENITGAIDEVLAREHQRRPTFDDGRETPSKLTDAERRIYTLIIAYAKSQAKLKPLEWLKHRPLNGPGRLDAFGALRFEFLGFEFEREHIATVDLPSIWHQQTNWRPWHHWDGNTDQDRARNFGAIVGIGGRPETLRRRELLMVGQWLNQELQPTLAPPPFPFKTADHDANSPIFLRGKKVYSVACSTCHGTYDDAGNLAAPTPCMRDPEAIPSQGTDPHRYQSIDQTFVDKLNRFGSDVSIWGPSAFRPGRGYLCPPLDGLWARAPYLHNGSVPTLAHLVGPVSERPKTFERGNPAYDVKLGGFVFATPPVGRARFTLDTTAHGNSNAGHEHLVADPADRSALIVYLQTL
ncbi:MAG: hypothetical protein ACOY0T_28400 [Myxococcota bacterium]